MIEGGLSEERVGERKGMDGRRGEGTEEGRGKEVMMEGGTVDISRDKGWSNYRYLKE